MKTIYVAGFLFNRTSDYVALVEKKKFPKGQDWSAHPLNAIGGHVEPGEDPHVAMVREFKEETGVEIPAWEQFLILESDHWIVLFYRAFDDRVNDVKTIESEQIILQSVGVRTRLMPNLHWIMPMALDKDVRTEAGTCDERGVEARHGSVVYSR